VEHTHLHARERPRNCNDWTSTIRTSILAASATGALQVFP
jgi:hypothetical protein